MAAKKICEHCKKEYTPIVPDQRFCKKECRYDFHNAEKAVERVYTRETVDALVKKIDKLMKQNEQLVALVQSLMFQLETSPKKSVSSQQEVSIANTQMSGIKVPYREGLELVEDDGYQPVPPSERGISDGDMPLVEVKQSATADNANVNMLNSLAALMNG